MQAKNFDPEIPSLVPESGTRNSWGIRQ